MRGRNLVVGFAASAMVSALIFAGCGGDTNSTPAATDGGKDVGVKEAAATETSTTGDGAIQDAAAPVCENDADLVSGTIPDAPIGDSGATTAQCVACARTKCTSELNTCNGKCECRQLITGLFDCLGGSGDLVACGSALILGSPPDEARGLGSCMIPNCASACGAGGLVGDSGPRDSGGDVTSDAPTDAGGG